MLTSEENTVFACVAAWPNWQEKIDVYYRSAVKQGINLEVLDRGEPWKGYYQHKILNLKSWMQSLKNNRPNIEYIVFTDARDAVYIKPQKSILNSLRPFKDGQVLLMTNQRHPWPLQTQWFAEEIIRNFGADGYVNSGCCAGHIDTYIKLLDECIALHERLESGDVRDENEKRILSCVHKSHLDSDQFHIQAMQILCPKLIAVDTECRVFAGFTGKFPRLKTAPELYVNGSMPLGTAGILHSPWMFMRNNQTQENISRWRKWAEQEEII